MGKIGVPVEAILFGCPVRGYYCPWARTVGTLTYSQASSGGRSLQGLVGPAPPCDLPITLNTKCIELRPNGDRILKLMPRKSLYIITRGPYILGLYLAGLWRSVGIHSHLTAPYEFKRLHSHLWKDSRAYTKDTL